MLEKITVSSNPQAKEVKKMPNYNHSVQEKEAKYHEFTSLSRLPLYSKGLREAHIVPKRR